MAEIIYHHCGKRISQDETDIRWLSREDIQIFNRHLLMCGQKPISQDTWNQICDNDTLYCLLFVNGLPVARACVERYSETVWEVADVRVAKSYRNNGFAFKVCLFVLNYILEHNKTAAIRTENDNYPMQKVIEKLGFVAQNDDN